jgi:hypothetical protein
MRRQGAPKLGAPKTGEELGTSSSSSRLRAADCSWVKVAVTSRQLQSNPGKTPPLIVPASDGYSLLGGEALTVTFQAQVQNPPPAGVSQILNRASTVSNETITPIFDIAIDKLAVGGALGDRVWHDADGDGIQDIGEPGLANVTLAIYDAGANLVPGGGDDVLIATIKSDLNGNYLFSALGPGVYFVDVDGATTPSGLVISPGSTDPSSVRVITTSEQYFDVDFGYTHDDPTAAAIGDRVWSDGDGDGVQDPGEPGVAGVTVNLVNGSGITVDTTTTGPDGSYLFTGVAAGDCTIEIDSVSLGSGRALEGFTATVGPQSVGSTDSPPIQVIAGDVYLEADFGYQNAALADISGNVFDDKDRDGVDDGAVDPGIAGVTLELLDSGGDTVAVTTSDVNGDYSFVDLPAGDYTVRVTDKDGVLTNSELTSGADQLPVSLGATNVTGVDFNATRRSRRSAIGCGSTPTVTGSRMAPRAESRTSCCWVIRRYHWRRR